MKPRSLVRLLILQTVLMVALAWGLVYLGRDEYRQWVGRADDDDLPAASQVVTDDDGLPEVRVGAAAQRLVGIQTAEPVAAGSVPETTLPLTVVDPQPLAELRARLLAARQGLAQANAAAAGSEAERRRVQALFDDDRNASQRSLEQARAQAAADQLQAQGARQQLDAASDAARAAWGPTLAGWVLPADRGTSPATDRLAAVLSGREVLLRAVLRADDVGVPPAPLRLQRPGSAALVTAQLLGPVPAPAGADAGAGGRHLLYLAPGQGLAVGMRLPGRAAGGQVAASGMTVPSSAVIWHAGQPWIYVRESGEEGAPLAAPGPGKAGSAAAASSAAGAPAAPATDRFQRRGIPGAQRQGDRWFVPGLGDDDPVVVRGAQVLLSEELKYQIKNENDD